MKRFKVLLTAVLFLTGFAAFAQESIPLLDKALGHRVSFDYSYRLSLKGADMYEVTSGKMVVEDNCFNLTGLGLSMLSDGKTRWTLDNEAKEVLGNLRELGISNMVMLTGDSPQAAGYVAQELTLDDYKAQVLPEDKSSYVDELKRQGHTVIMVGDGINDSPALAASDVSVALSDASDIARAVADVAVMDNSLESLVTMRVLSQRLMHRIKRDYNFIVGFNTGLIVLGVAGVLSVTTAAYLHNGTTLATVALNTRKLLA